MSKLGDFFIFCSGVNRHLLNESPTEYNKYTGVGATVFFTGVFAMIASSYALYTVFNNAYTAIAFGLVWGLLIFNLDRYIVSSMKKKGVAWKDITFALPRVVLAVIISIVISKPLELKIFETEINSEIISMQQEKRKEHETLLKSRFEADITKVDLEIAELNSDIKRMKTLKDDLNLEALKEADGTGGSKIRNLGPIYKAKVKVATDAESEYESKLQTTAPLLASKEERKKAILVQRDTEMAQMEKASLTGFASRLEALDRLSQKSYAVFIAGIFIMLLFVCIETAPIFVKLISERAPYDYILDKIEVAFEMDHKKVTTLNKLEINNLVELETKTKNHRTIETIKADNELFTHAMKSEVEGLKQNTSGLKEYLKRGKMIID